MYTKTFIITATALVISLSARAQEPETAKPDSLGTIQNLKEVIVVSQQELITTDADKLTYNVQADPQAESGNLIDILRNVPMLSINGEEKVLLNGSPDFKVLVNGRPTGMLAKNFEQLIKTVPASSIKEIQVITNPPVKYDAEGIGGIINIVSLRQVSSFVVIPRMSTGARKRETIRAVIPEIEHTTIAFACISIAIQAVECEIASTGF